MSNAPVASPFRLTWTVFRRELAQFFQTPGTYVALAFFLFLAGAVFARSIVEYTALSAMVQSGKSLPEGEMPLNLTIRFGTQMFLFLNFLMVFLVPVLTMRLVCEERRNGTFELLVSTPLGNWSILLGKYFATLFVGLLVVVICAVYPLIAGMLGPIEYPVLLNCYFGLFLLTMAYAAFGLFASAVTESQIAAAVLSFVGLLVFYMVGWLFKSGVAGVFGSLLSFQKRSENFTEGVLALENVTYLVCFAVFFLFLTAQILDARRYRA